MRLCCKSAARLTVKKQPSDRHRFQHFLSVHCFVISAPHIFPESMSAIVIDSLSVNPEMTIWTENDPSS